MTVPGKRSSTAAAITWAVEWRRVSRSSLMADPLQGAAHYTERVGTERAGLDGAEPLQTGRDVFPAERAVVERRLDVPVDLEHQRELMRQGNDRCAPSLTSKALLPIGVHRTTTNAAVFGGYLLDGGITAGPSADLERNSLLQTVSDPNRFSLFTRSLPRPTPLTRY